VVLRKSKLLSSYSRFSNYPAVCLEASFSIFDFGCIQATQQRWKLYFVRPAKGHLRMAHKADHMQPQQFEIESYAENVGREPNTDVNHEGSDDKQFEWVHEERNFIDADSSCKELFFVNLLLTNENPETRLTLITRS
jgi:hypothetical protein